MFRLQKSTFSKRSHCVFLSLRKPHLELNFCNCSLALSRLSNWDTKWTENIFMKQKLYNAINFWLFWMKKVSNFLMTVSAQVFESLAKITRVFFTFYWIFSVSWKLFQVLKNENQEKKLKSIVSDFWIESVILKFCVSERYSIIIS